MKAEAVKTDLREVLRARAIELARVPRAVDDRRALLLVFVLGPFRLALPPSEVASVIAPRWTTRIPGAPAHINRVAYVDGRVVTIVDLALLLRGGPADDAAVKPQGSRKVLLLGDATLALAADHVVGMTAIDLDRLTSKDEGTGSERAAPFIRGTTPEMTMVLDVAALGARLGRRRPDGT